MRLSEGSHTELLFSGDLTYIFFGEHPGEAQVTGHLGLKKPILPEVGIKAICCRRNLDNSKRGSSPRQQPVSILNKERTHWLLYVGTGTLCPVDDARGQSQTRPRDFSSDEDRGRVTFVCLVMCI